MGSLVRPSDVECFDYRFGFFQRGSCWLAHETKLGSLGI